MHICVILCSFVYYCEMSSVCVCVRGACVLIFCCYFSLPEMMNKVGYIACRRYSDPSL